MTHDTEGLHQRIAELRSERDSLAARLREVERGDAEALREAIDALEMYVTGIEQYRHAEGQGRMRNYHASSSAGGRKALNAARSALTAPDDGD